MIYNTLEFTWFDYIPSDRTHLSNGVVSVRIREIDKKIPIIVSEDLDNNLNLATDLVDCDVYIDYDSVFYADGDVTFNIKIDKTTTIGKVEGAITLDCDIVVGADNYQGVSVSDLFMLGGAGDPQMIPSMIPIPSDKTAINIDPKLGDSYRFYNSLQDCNVAPIFDESRKINLTKYVPELYDNHSVKDMIQTFEDQLNEFAEGRTIQDPKATHISILEKIDQLLDLQDPDRIPIELIHHLANNLGYDMSINILQSSDISNESSDLKKYLRFFVSSLVEINRIKTTKDAVRGLMHSVGIMTNIYYKWTSDYDSEQEIHWKESNENDIYDDEGIPNVHITDEDFWLTPHFRLDLDISRIDISDSEMMVGILRRSAQSIDAIRPVQAVSQDLSLSIPITQEFALKSVFVRGWGDYVNSYPAVMTPIPYKAVFSGGSYFHLPSPVVWEQGKKLTLELDIRFDLDSSNRQNLEPITMFETGLGFFTGDTYLVNTSGLGIGMDGNRHTYKYEWYDTELGDNVVNMWTDGANMMSIVFTDVQKGQPDIIGIYTPNAPELLFGDLYSMKVWKDGVLVYDIVPRANDFYDTISEVSIQSVTEYPTGTQIPTEFVKVI